MANVPLHDECLTVAYLARLLERLQTLQIQNAAVQEYTLPLLPQHFCSIGGEEGGAKRKLGGSGQSCRDNRIWETVPGKTFLARQGSPRCFKNTTLSQPAVPQH